MKKIRNVLIILLLGATMVSIAGCKITVTEFDKNTMQYVDKDYTYVIPLLIAIVVVAIGCGLITAYFAYDRQLKPLPYFFVGFGPGLLCGPIGGAIGILAMYFGVRDKGESQRAARKQAFQQQHYQQTEPQQPGATPVTPQAEVTGFCGKCGAVLVPEYSFCSVCGWKIPDRK